MNVNPSRTSDRPIPAVLRDIVAAANRRVMELRRITTQQALEVESHRHTKRSLILALEKSCPAIIAEVKKASPSKGVFREDFLPVTLVSQYQSGGAAALSVVTEPVFFQGDNRWISQIREVSNLPVLRKDFIIDPIQVAESGAAGADAILLIARILSTEQLSSLTTVARELGLEVLYEAHDAADLELISPLHPDLVGINSRNLDDFSVSMDAFSVLHGSIPESAFSIAESGIESHSQIGELMTIGYRGFLIGETLIRSADPVSELRCLRGETE